MTGDAADFAALALKTQEVYERSAQVFDALRDKPLFERGWLDRFLSHLPDTPAILDLGCGAAEPIAAYLIKRDADVMGIDASAAMIGVARARFPAAAGDRWICAPLISPSVLTAFSAGTAFFI